MKSVDLQTKLSDWIQDRPAWFSYVLNDVLKMKAIDGNDIERYTSLCLQEMEEKNLNRAEVVFDQLSISPESEKFSLLEIANVENVNAIAPERTLGFSGEGLTVVYGDNGSGKTGYVRALKRACGVSASEVIKSNIYSSKLTYRQQKCLIKISSSEEPIECQLDFKSKGSIKGVSIFDTSVSNDYIGNVREASFEPKIFRMLSEFSRVVDLVKSNFSVKKIALGITLPEIPGDIKSASVIKKYLNMSEATILLDEDFNWLVEDERELKSLKQRLSETDPESKINEIEKQYKSLERIVSYVDRLSLFYTQEKKNKINDYLKNIDQLKEGYNILGDSFAYNSSDIDRLSQENAAWRNLWKYAREYYLFLEKYKYSNRCPLCMQNMNDDVATRFDTIDEYVNNKIVIDIEKLKNNVKKEFTKKFSIMDDETLRVLWNSVMIENVFNNELLSHLVNLSSNLEIINTYDDVESYDRCLKLNRHLSDMKKVIRKRKDDLKRDQDRLERIQKGDAFQELRTEILELEARKHLSTNKEIYYEYSKSLGEIKRLENAEKTAVTNSITRLTSFLSTEILLKDYEERFNDELDKLTNGKVRVKLVRAKGGKGRVPFKIIVEDSSGKEHNPRDILSEGEQRVVSIAAYIADNQIGESFGPFVFDDPISSLDFEYEGSTIRRITELAKSRQVIVFTHRISMVCALKEVCKNYDVSFYNVSIISSGKLKGIPAIGILEKIKVKESLNRMLNGDITSIKNYDIASREYQLGISGLCSDFRIIVEKSIEDILLCGITGRFERNIHSTNVKKLKKLNNSDIEMVDGMMSKYSFGEHSHSEETPYNIPEIEEIEQDIRDFLRWSVEARKRLES